jgi:hypothetical protein
MLYIFNNDIYNILYIRSSILVRTKKGDKMFGLKINFNIYNELSYCNLKHKCKYRNIFKRCKINEIKAYHIGYPEDALCVINEKFRDTKGE